MKDFILGDALRNPEYRTQAREEFIKHYGKIGMPLDEETWLNWFAVFMIGFDAGFRAKEERKE